MFGTAGTNHERPHVAFGPVAPGWGSWDWVGHDICQALTDQFRTSTFAGDECPQADLIVVVKHLPPLALLEDWSRQSSIIYCPIDYFGSAGAIDQEAASLRLCSRIVIHADGLRKYFAPYAPVSYIDHHVKFIGPQMASFSPDGHILWVGVRTNLPALEAWLQEHRLPRELLILTNFEEPSGTPPALRTGDNRVRIAHWTPDLHRRSLQGASAALDIKGTDFRARHKPPAKALDFLAAGVPLAMNADSSSSHYVHRLGFNLALPDDVRRWLSRGYWEETHRFGAAIRELLSLERVAWRWKVLLDELCLEGVPCEVEALAANR